MEIDISIDELTNCLISSETGEECDTEYRLVTRTISKNDAKMLKAMDGSLTGAYRTKRDMKCMSYF